MGEVLKRLIFIHCTRAGQGTVKFPKTTEEAASLGLSYAGEYKYLLNSYDDLLKANIPPLVLRAACESLKARVPAKLKSKRAWKIMSDQSKAVENAEVKGAADAKKAAAEEKKAAAEKAKADKLKAAEDAKAAKEKEKADKKKAAEDAKAAKEKEKAEKASTGGKVVDKRIIRKIKETAEFRGKRAEAFAALKDGMTVSEWVEVAHPIFNDATAGTHLLGIYLVKELVKLDPPATAAA